MLKYQGCAVTFQEVPDEVSLCINIASCPYHCKGCHSPELQTDKGEELTYNVFFSLLNRYKDEITCVCFMGDGGDFEAVAKLANEVRVPLKTCLYTGAELKNIPSEVLNVFDYIKAGPYIESLGGLDSPTTNQMMFKNITKAFQRKE